MLSFTWDYDYARGGAVVSATSSEGEVTEVGLVNNGNVAQILCDALHAQHTGYQFAPRVRMNDRSEGACLSWLGYINPPRPAVEAGHLCDQECGDPSHPQDGRCT